MTFNSKTTKKELIEYLKEMQPKLIGKKFKDVAVRVAYNLKGVARDIKQVSQSDLLELSTDVMNLWNSSQKPVPVENSLKVAPKAPAANAPANAPASTAKKASLSVKGKPDSAPAEKTQPAAKQAAPKVETETQVSAAQRVLASKFPANYASDLGELKLNDKIKTMKDLYKAVVTDGKDIVFAFYWSKRLLSQFAYDPDNIAGKKFREFPNELDLAKAVYVSEDDRVAYAVSLYSEVMYAIQPSDLPIENGLRFCKGCEYNLYEVVEEKK